MPALITNAVGSYPKPEYLAQPRSQFSQGKIDRAELDKLERKATEYWIRSQERIGLDVLVHGEMERGDMVAYFAGEPGGNPIGGMKLGGLVRSYGNRYYHKPIIVDKLTWPGPMTVDMWRYAQSLTDRPVKGMLTGAYTMVEWSFDDYYPSRREAVLDMAPIIRREVEELVKAGAKYIQIDEPAIHTRPNEDFDLAVEAMEIVTRGLRAYTITHVCYGDVPRIYPAMLRLAVNQIDLALKNEDFALLETFRSPRFTKDIGLGVLDAHSHRVETTDEVVEGIRRTLTVIPLEQ